MPAFVFGSFQLYPARRLLLDGGVPVRLGSRAFDILVLLLERAGQVVGKEELLARVWTDIAVEEANLRVHVAGLRKVLGDNNPEMRFVTNVPGRGYCFVAPVALLQDLAPEPPRNAAPKMRLNLPAPHTRVVGRSDEVRLLRDLLARRRLVTVVGPGGIGKTTVALAAAESLSAAYADGAAFFDLGPIGDPALLPGALASVLGVPGHTDGAAPALAAFLRDKAMLLVLDGCEHVIEAAAALVDSLIRAAPDLVILTTSQEPLRVEGEWVQRLASLGLPPASGILTAAAVLRFPAVQLFIERAAATMGGFELDDANALAVAEICHRLDGNPLAIELAAARTDAFNPRELAALLDDGFRVLTQGRRTALPRHRTLRATMDWSHALLSGPERVLLRRLSVFSGSFVLAAAADIAAGQEIPEPEVSDLLASLVAKSLVLAEGGDAEVHYRLLTTTRIYAREKLAEGGEAERLAQRHAERLRRLFERAEAEWETRPTGEWLAAYARHVDDLRAALSWAFSASGDGALGVALTVTAVPLWFQMSLVDECLSWVERALAALAATPDGDLRRRMQLHAALGWPQMYAANRMAKSAAAWRIGLGLAEELGDVDYQLRALWALWADRQNHGEFREALALAHRFSTLADREGEPGDCLVGDRMAGASLHFLGEQDQARAHIESVLVHYVAPIRRSHAVRFQFDQRITARITLARILWLQGFPDQALQDVQGNVEEAVALGHALSLSNALAQAACPVVLLAGDLASARRYSDMLRRNSAEHALDVWRAYANLFDGELLVRGGDHAAGLQMLRPAVDELRRAGFTQYLTSFLGSLAQALLGAGRTEEALLATDEALNRCELTGERWYLAELLRIRGEALARVEAPCSREDAEALFRNAIQIARSQGALSWELRASTSLAAHLRRKGRPAEGLTLLASVLPRFSEGFTTPDLQQAARLLEELGHPLPL